MNIMQYFKKTKEVAQKKPVDIKKEQSSYYEAVKAFEKDRLAIVATRAKLFLRLSVVELVVIIALAFAIARLAPLKTAVPYVIRVDASTGYTDIARSLSDSKETYEQAVAKYFLSLYVINYESYDWQTVQQMFDTIKIMSSNQVFSAYKNAMLADNSPLNVLKDQYKMKVKIKSVTLLKEDVAQVRFAKMILQTDGKLAPEYAVTSWIATISFDYKKPIVTEGERLINPLGFQSLSYRVDPEAIK